MEQSAAPPRPLRRKSAAGRPIVAILEIMAEQQRLQAAIAALESRRELLGDAVVDTAVSPLRAHLLALNAANAEPEQKLKQISILFLDVVGSTARLQRMDPEEISAVMDTALARGTEIILAHRGKALQYAGDSILAVFGADEAREDDAENAVRCGLALLRLGHPAGAERLTNGAPQEFTPCRIAADHCASSER